MEWIAGLEPATLCLEINSGKIFATKEPSESIGNDLEYSLNQKWAKDGRFIFGRSPSVPRSVPFRVRLGKIQWGFVGRGRNKKALRSCQFSRRINILKGLMLVAGSGFEPETFGL